MADLRPEHADCQTTPFTKNQRSGEVLTFRNKIGPTGIGNWIFVVVSFFLSAIFVQLPNIFYQLHFWKSRGWKLKVLQFPHPSTSGYILKHFCNCLLCNNLAKKKGCETCERSFILQLKKERRTILLSLSCFVSFPEEAANSASFLDIDFSKKLQRNSGKA